MRSERLRLRVPEQAGCHHEGKTCDAQTSLWLGVVRDRSAARKAGQGHQREFLTVGSMGHASQIAMGIALARPDRQVYCLDGDGAMLMHMGSAAIVGAAARSLWIAD